jgi:hypothetical protein
MNSNRIIGTSSTHLPSCVQKLCIMGTAINSMRISCANETCCLEVNQVISIGDRYSGRQEKRGNARRDFRFLCSRLNDPRDSADKLGDDTVSYVLPPHSNSYMVEGSGDFSCTRMTNFKSSSG